MKKGTWRKQHKWLGIGMSFFMLMFCLSGILLNHRSLIKDVNISRKYLPSRYEFRNWNGGLLRGTLDLDKGLGQTLCLYRTLVIICCFTVMVAFGLQIPRLHFSRASTKICLQGQTTDRLEM